MEFIEKKVVRFFIYRWHVSRAWEVVVTNIYRKCWLGEILVIFFYFSFFQQWILQSHFLVSYSLKVEEISSLDLLLSTMVFCHFLLLVSYLI